MAKKVRKPRSANPRTFGQAGAQPAQTAPPAQPAPKAQPQPDSKPATSPTAVASRAARKVDLRAEYPFVGKDLRRLGYTAAAMFAVLVMLNLVLTFVL